MGSCTLVFDSRVCAHVESLGKLIVLNRFGHELTLYFMYMTEKAPSFILLPIDIFWGKYIVNSFEVSAMREK